MALTAVEQAELKALRALDVKTQAPPTQAPQAYTGGQKAMGGLESFGQGASLGLGDEASSAMLAAIPSMRLKGETYVKAYERLQKVNQTRMAAFRKAYPEIAIPAQIAGGIPMSIATGGGSTIPQTIAREATLGGIEGAGSAPSGQKLVGGGIGFGFGGVAGGAGGVLGRSEPLESIAEVAKRAQARTKKQILTRSQLTGSPMGGRLESGLETLPIAGAPTRMIKRNFQETLNSAAAKRIGVPGNKTLTPDVLSQAQTKISRMFSEAIDLGDVYIYPDHLEAIRAIGADFAGLPGKGSSSFNRTIKDLLNELKTGKMTGKRYQRLSSFFGKETKKYAKAGDSERVEALWSIKDQLDNIVENSLGTETLGKFKEARRYYKNFMELTKNKSVINPATGNVNGRSLFAQMAQNEKSWNVTGELGDLARLSTLPGLGDSGTASRMLPAAAIGLGVGVGGVEAGVSGGLALGGLGLLNLAAQKGAPGAAAVAGATQRALTNQTIEE